MRAARVVRRELDGWRTAWQQVETFIDRIDGARDQDDPHRAKLEALLRSAAVVERRRSMLFGSVALSDPVIDSLPAQYYDPNTGATEFAGETKAWSVALRRWRLPGTDEAELAAGNLATTPVDPDADDPDPPKALDKVVLIHRRDVFERRVDGTLNMLSVPSYSGAVLTADQQPETKPDDGDHDRGSLFSRPRRFRATMDLFDDEEPLLTWSELCANRRSGATEDTVLYSGVGGLEAVSFAGLAAEASAIVGALTNPLIPDVDVPSRLVTLAAQARTAVSMGSIDAVTLTAAADVLADEGTKTESLPDELRATAEFIGRPTALGELASAADALRADLSSSAARARFTTAAAALSAPASPPLLLLVPVESGVLSADLNDSLGARIAYPDGTLRQLRALEVAFATNWRLLLRWLRIRHATTLDPVLRRFRAPFVDSVRALVLGGQCLFPCEGLTIGADLAIGSDAVITAQPATMRAALSEMRPGRVAVLAGDRPTALVIIGLSVRGDRFVLSVSPVRLSIASEGAGSPGVVRIGEPILCSAPGLSGDELRSGEAADGPAGDGLVHETMSLWTRLRLVFGSAVIDSEAGAGLVPDPTSTPLESLILHGSIPSLAGVLVVSGLDDEWWDRSDGSAVPRFARPGEVLLVRGFAEARGEDPAGVVQGAVEVDRVFRTTGSMLDRMDLAGAGRLSTTPFDPDAGDGRRCVPCGDEDDVLVVLLSRSWLRRPIVSDITLRRDFVGFDGPSLAAEQLLPPQVIAEVLAPAPAPIGPPNVDRSFEFQAAIDTMRGWLRYADDE